LEGLTCGSLFIPSAQDLTGLTGASHWSDQCGPLFGVGSGELLGSCDLGLWCSWSVLGRFQGVLLGFVKVFLSLQFVSWWWFLFQGLEESLRHPGMFLCVFCSTSLTGLTGEGHRSDRCGTDNESYRFPLCVWCVCFSGLRFFLLESVAL
jgi:hypothetical protein